MHLVRYYGAYANRLRNSIRAARLRLAGHEPPSSVPGDPPELVSPFEPRAPP